MASYPCTKAAQPAHMQGYGNMSVYDDTSVIGAALALNDVVDLIRLPAGSRLEQLVFPVYSDFDSGTALVFSLGYRAVLAGGVSGSFVDNPSAFGTGFTFLRTAAAVGAVGVTEIAVNPTTFNEEVYLTLTVTTAPAGGSAGGTIATRATTNTVGVK